MVPITVAFVCLLLQGQLLHEAVDRAEDHAGGVRTTVLFAGDRWAAALASGLGFGLVALAWRLHGAWFAWPLAVVYGGAFPVVLASRGSDHEAMTRARRAHRLSALVTGAWILVWLR
jgi:4-hydroxybenzoate polyprenyltransferase